MWLSMARKRAGSSSVVTAAWCLLLCGASAPRRSGPGSRSHRPVATPYRNTCDATCRTRCARSCAPCCSIFRRAAKSAGALISEIGFAPISGNRLDCNRRSTSDAWWGTHTCACFAYHSSATASKLFAARPAASRFSAFRCSPGSTRDDSNLRAASLPLRASARGTSFKTPREISLRLPPKRYAKRHQRPPLGEISRYSPPASYNRSGLAPAFAFRIAVAVRGMAVTIVGSAVDAAKDTAAYRPLSTDGFGLIYINLGPLRSEHYGVAGLARTS